MKNEVGPSFLSILAIILTPLSGFSKFLFWILVLTTSNGAETIKDAEAPQMEAIKFWYQEALL